MARNKIVVFGPRFWAIVAFSLGLGTSQAEGQRIVDHWSTARECLVANGAPFYYPIILRQQRLAENEVRLGHPTGGCFEMDLPDRSGGRGWVRIEAGRAFVFDQESGKELRLAECNNSVHAVALFPPLQRLAGERGPAGPQGPQGPAGPAGRDFTPPPLKKGWCGWKCKSALVISAVVAGVVIEHNWPKDQDPEVMGPSVETGTARAVLARIIF